MASNGGGWTESSTLNSTNGIRIVGFRSDKKSEQEAQVHPRAGFRIGKVHGSQDRTPVFHEDLYQDTASGQGINAVPTIPLSGETDRELQQSQIFNCHVAQADRQDHLCGGLYHMVCDVSTRFTDPDCGTQVPGSIGHHVSGALRV